MSKEKDNKKPSSTVICNLYPTKPSDYIKLYNPFETKENGKNKIKKEDELQNDEPILEKLLREPDDKRRYSDQHTDEHLRYRGENPNMGIVPNSNNQLSHDRYSDMSEPQEVHVVYTHKLDVKEHSSN